MYMSSGSQVRVESHYVSLQGLFANQDQGSLTLDEYKTYRDTQFKDTGMNLMQQLRCIIDVSKFLSSCLTSTVLSFLFETLIDSMNYKYRSIEKLF